METTADPHLSQFSPTLINGEKFDLTVTSITNASEDKHTLPAPIAGLWQTTINDTDSDPVVPAEEQELPQHTLEKFTPMVEMTNIRDYFGFNCCLLAKCSYMNEMGLGATSMGMKIVDQESPDAMPVTWSRHGLALSTCFASAIRRIPNPIYMQTVNKIPRTRQLSSNDANLLRCIGTKIISVPCSNYIFEDEYSVTDLCDKFQDINLNPLALAGEEYGLLLQSRMIQPLYELVYQTKAQFDLLVCDVPMARILLANEHFPGFVTKYNLACVEEEYSAADLMKPLVDDKKEIPGLFKLRVPKAAARIMSYHLLHKEGLVCSASSCLTMAGAIVAAKALGFNGSARAKVVVLLSEGILHESCFESLEYDWLLRKNIWSKSYFEQYECWWWSIFIYEIGLKPIALTYQSMTIDEAISLMREFEVDHIGIEHEEPECGRLAGVVSLASLESYITLDDRELYEESSVNTNPGQRPVSTVMSKCLAYGDLNNVRMGKISCLLVHAEYLIVTMKLENSNLEEVNKEEMDSGKLIRVVGILSSEDLIQYKTVTFLTHFDRGTILKG